MCDFTVPSGMPVRSAICTWVRSSKKASSMIPRWGWPRRSSSSSSSTRSATRASNVGVIAGAACASAVAASVARRWRSRFAQASAILWRQMPTSQAGRGPESRRYPPRPVQADMKTCWVMSSASGPDPKARTAMPWIWPAQRS
jgi:hypothetical protein